MTILKSRKSGNFYETTENHGMELAHGEIAVFPLGGGFIGKVRAEDMVEELPPSTMMNGMANIDGEGDYPCIFNPNRRWNGWACPQFTREVIERIAKDWGTEIVKVHDHEYFFNEEYDGEPMNGIMLVEYENGLFELSGVCWDCDEAETA